MQKGNLEFLSIKKSRQTEVTMVSDKRNATQYTLKSMRRILTTEQEFYSDSSLSTKPEVKNDRYISRSNHDSCIQKFLEKMERKLKVLNPLMPLGLPVVWLKRKRATYLAPCQKRVDINENYNNGPQVDTGWS